MVSNKFASTQLPALSVIRMITKQKLVVGVVWMLAAAIGSVIVFRIPSTYRAEALILVISQKIPEKYVASTVNADLQDRLSSIGQQILSVSRLKKLIDDLNLYPEAKNGLSQEEIVEMMRRDIK